MKSFLSHGVLLSLSALLVAVTPLPFQNEKMFAMRGGGLFGKEEKDKDTTTATVGTGKKYPAMTQEEVEEWLAHIPVFAVTDSTGNGVVLKPDDGASVFYFFMSAQMANATLTQLKGGQDDMDLRVSAFSLGKVWFKVLKSNKQTSVKLKQPGSTSEEGVVTNDVDYRLVPDTRDLLGARMLLTMDPEDGEALKAGGTLSPEMAQAAIKKAMSESPKFNSTYNEIPVFMIQQMRMQKPNEDGTVDKDTPIILPMYFNLQNMVSLWQQFTSQSAEAKGVEPAINLMDLNELVEKMQEESEIDFRNVVLVPPTPAGSRPMDATSANGQPVTPTPPSSDEPFKMPGDTTLGDL